MMDQPIIDVAVGLVFFYVVLSLVCSSIQEVVASLLGLRSRNLKKGIENLVGETYASAVYDHPLIKGLRKPNKFPSYIKPEIFADALLDVIAKNKGNKSANELSIEGLRESIERIDDESPAKELLLVFVDRAEDTVENVKERFTSWFDGAMDRVSGWYKRQVKYCLLAIATLVTVSVNGDTIHIAEQLWRDDALRAAIAAQAEQTVQEGVADEPDVTLLLDTFPLGYPETFPGIGFKVIVGWILTIAAISLGAPFWFDLLSKISHLRASGTKEANLAEEKTV